MTKNPKIAAVVVTYNRKELLRECLRALLNQTRPLDEIIVIDNASTDGTEEMVRTEFPKITYVRLPENIGGAGGFHEGIKLAYEKGYDWIWVMDDDADPVSNALEELLNPDFLHDQDVGALASAVLNPDGTVDVAHRRVFNSKTATERPIELNRYKEKFFQSDTVSFVGMLISRKTVSEVGLPERHFFIYYDDTEYSLRIRTTGKKILTIPPSKIVHKTARRVECGSRKMPLSWRTYYGFRNMIYTYKKYGPGGVKFYLRIFAIALKIQVGIVLFKRRKILSSKILWKGILDGLRGRLGRTIKPKEIKY